MAVDTRFSLEFLSRFEDHLERWLFLGATLFPFGPGGGIAPPVPSS
jgi:hypothetical protein